jgi:hypothetical protein
LRASAIAVVAAAVALGAVAGPATGGDAKAKADTTKSNAEPRVDIKHGCKVVKRSDLESVLGGVATSNGDVRQGPDWLCRWTIGADGERPAGTLKVNVAFKVPPGACDALSKVARYETLDGTDGLDDAVFEPLVARLTVCKKKRIVVLQGVFNDASVRPIRTYDARAELVELAGVAQSRL